MHKKILSLFIATFALWLGATRAFAQVSLHGVYASAIANGPTALFAVHDGGNVGIYVWDFTQKQVGHVETKIDANGAFSANNLIGYSVSGTLTSAVVGTVPAINGTFTLGSTAIPFAISRDALFGQGNSLTFEGRFEGIAAYPSGVHRTHVTFFVDSNFNLYFAHLLANGTYVGGTGVLTATSNAAGTFAATNIDGTAIAGTFTTDGYIMDGTFSMTGTNYEFQAYRVGAAYRLLNISIRGFVGTGNQVLIGGFVIAGGPKLVYIRVVGPGLNGLVDGYLTAPSVTLYSGQKTIAANTGWSTAPNADQIGKTPYPPLSTADSAILTVLEPGPYTTVVTGANATTGIALVEVYELGVH